jgi:ribosomal protein L7Ae-like RNA K-turn-binding protein
MTILPTLQRALNRRTALKVISGLQNFDRANVAAVVKAAELGGATFVDIAADADLIRMVKGLTTLSVSQQWILNCL